MQLANNEHIIREWEYATSKVGVADLNKTRATLTVTNKRIVHDVRNKLEVTRDEIQLQDVKSVHMSHSTKSKLVPFLIIAMGIVAIIAGIILSSNTPAILPVFIVLGLILVVVGVLKLRGGALTVTVITRDSESTSLSIGAWGGKGLGKKKSGNVQVVVNNAVAHEIIDMLGAVIIDSQAKEITVSDFAAQH